MHSEFSSDDHDMLIEMRADLRYLKESVERTIGRLDQLDNEAVKKPALIKILSLFAGLMTGIAAWFNIYYGGHGT